MRLATVIAGNGPRLVGRAGSELVDLQKASALIGGETLPNDMLDLLDGGPALMRRCREALEVAEGALGSSPERASLEGAGAVYSSDRVRWLAPVPRPRKIVCVGLNYRDHIAEAKLKTPEEPFLFPKFSSAAAGPYDSISPHSLTEKLDFEAELAVVIGRRAKNVRAGDAMDCVAGYMAANDISARDLQETQLSLSKSGDGFGPMGPFLVTADEVPDPHNLRVQSWVNGVQMQSSSTSYLLFRISDLISFCSRVSTMEPGDVIFTGTPHGVGHFRQPPVYLKPGDVLVTAIEGLGELRNTIADG